jgi:sarcosine oxidase subunit beta
VETVVVLESAAAVGQGSSAKANGGFRAQFTTAINIEFSRYSIAELERLNDLSDGLVGLHQTGYLMFTGTDAGAEQLRAACKLQRSLGVETEWLSPSEIVERAPFVRAEGLLAGTFHQRDGFLDPHGTVTALKQEAQRNGATIRTGAEVRAIERAGGGLEILTATGSVAASWVVNAAGAHARSVAAMLGVDLPVEPVRRNMAFIPDAKHDLVPMCVDLDTGVLVRREVGGGYLIAFANQGDPPGWETSLDPAFLGDVAERIGNRFPSVEAMPIDPHHCWAGLYPETADHHAIIGEVPGAEGIVHCAGFGGHGIMHSPAAGKAVAELVTQGACTTFDLHPLRPTRFAEGDLVVEAAVF